MQTKLISTDMYILLIDEEAEIKENTWYENKGLLFLSDCKYDEGNNPNNSNPRVTDFNNSVIAYYPLNSEAKELDLPLLPPFEESTSIKELALSLYNEPVNKRGEKRTQLVGHGGTPFGFNKWFKSFKVGYKAAQSKQFSLEDMRKAFQAGSDFGSAPFSGQGKELVTEEKYIQSLSTKQLPKEFVISDKFSTFEENIKNGKYKW